MSDQNPYRGYRITKYKGRTAAGAVAFDATLTRDGTAVATVSQSGRGGCHLHRFADRAERLAYEVYAVEFAPGNPEPVDALTDRLVAVADLNRARRIPYLHAGDPDVFETGAYRALKGWATFEDVLAFLASAPAGARMWVKAVSAFVPVEDLLDDAEDLTDMDEPPPCGHDSVQAGCGGCDGGAVEYVIDDARPGVRRAPRFDAHGIPS